MIAPNRSLFSGVLLTLSALCTLSSSAQKLPNVQQGSQWLPDAVNIDGKPEEIKQVMLAKNRATGLEYTLANNGDVLYLAIRTSDETTINRIMAGGITLLLSDPAKKSSPLFLATFPVRQLYTRMKDPSGMDNWLRGEILLDSTAVRKVLLTLKEIKVKLPGETREQMITVFNDEGIRTKLAYSNRVLSGEWAVPLALLAGQRILAYTVQVNGVPEAPPMQANGAAPPPPPRFPAPTMAGQPSNEILFSPTTVSGSYQLAEKP